MSYSRAFCRNNFTYGQGQRMRSAIANESVLSGITGNACSSISKIDFVCPSQTVTMTISNLNGATTTWSSSTNIQILSNNNSQVSFKAVSSNIQGDGWIRANLSNGIEFTEKFWIGKPQAYTTAPDPTICTNVFIQPNTYTLPISPGAESYQLTSNSSNLTVINPGAPELNVRMFASIPGRYTITLTTSNPCGSSQAAIYVTAQRCSGGGGFFNVYPNPASTILNLRTTDVERDWHGVDLSNYMLEAIYELYNFQSELVRSGRVKTLSEINVSELKKGRYILKIYLNGITENHHIIVK